jgi:hypothetical protein
MEFDYEGDRRSVAGDLEGDGGNDCSIREDVSEHTGDEDCTVDGAQFVVDGGLFISVDWEEMILWGGRCARI